MPHDEHRLDPVRGRLLRDGDGASMIPHPNMTQLTCVVCGQEGLDRLNLLDETAACRDHEAVTTFMDDDAYYEKSLNPMGTRGGFTEVGLICPSGHVQRFVIANHKGAEYVGLFPVVTP